MRTPNNWLFAGGILILLAGLGLANSLVISGNVVTIGFAIIIVSQLLFEKKRRELNKQPDDKMPALQ